MGMIAEFSYRARHHIRKSLLFVLGPARLDDDHDPIVQMDREWQAHMAKRRRNRERRRDRPAA